jgi:hypothetical protein
MLLLGLIGPPFSRPLQTLVEDPDTKAPRSALELYFIQQVPILPSQQTLFFSFDFFFPLFSLCFQNGSTFKAALPCCPYFYVGVKEGQYAEVETYLRRRHDAIYNIEIVEKEDLGLVTPSSSNFFSLSLLVADKATSPLRRKTTCLD